MAGLALAAVFTACGSHGDGVGRTAQLVFHEPSAAPSPTVPVDVEPTEAAETPPERAETQALNVGEDWTLRIPAIGVEAPVTGLEMTAERVLVPPRDPAVVGWWSQGAAPGERQGSAVLIGHSVSSGGGVFDDVDELDPGDTIEVENLDYRVQSVEVMSKPDLARRAEELFDQSVPGRLVIVTCEDWDGETWRSNAVAIATPA